MFQHVCEYECWLLVSVRIINDYRYAHYILSFVLAFLFNIHHTDTFGCAGPRHSVCRTLRPAFCQGS
jgi:hypothetical protein